MATEAVPVGALPPPPLLVILGADSVVACAAKFHRLVPSVKGVLVLQLMR
jgi:hypothetical protein